MDPKFSTLDLSPPVRPTGYRVAVVVLGLGLIGAIAAHLRSIGELRREFGVDAAKARECEEGRAGLVLEVAALRAEAPVKATASDAAAPVEPSPRALRAGDTEKAAAATTPRTATAGPATRGSPPSQEDVLSLIGGGQPSLQACYRRALRHNPNLGLRSLRFRLSFTVRSSGDVGAVAFQPSPGRELRGCLRNAVGTWRVKPFGGDPIAVEVPITLAPQG